MPQSALNHPLPPIPMPSPSPLPSHITPPLLLTKRLTALLHANLTPHIHSAILATPSGKILAHASTHTVGHLRAQSAAAASLCAVHAANAALASALPATAIPAQGQGPGADASVSSASSSPVIGGGGGLGIGRGGFPVRGGKDYGLRGGEYGYEEDDEGRVRIDSAEVSPTSTCRPATASSEGLGVRDQRLAMGETPGGSMTSGRPDSSRSTTGAITLRLAGGIAVIRKLRCGLLFVCIGPSSLATAAQQGQLAATNPDGTPLGPTNGTTTPHHHESNGGVPTSAAIGPPTGQTSPAHPPHAPSSPTETSDGGVSAAGQTTTSYVSGASSATTAAALRRHAEEIARWLDDKLGTLRVPEEGVGAD